MTLSNLQADVRYILGDLSSTNFSDTDLNRSLNKYLHQATAVAISASGVWDVSGEISTADIVKDQREYAFPTNLIRLIKIEANLPNSTNTWTTLNVVDKRGLDISNNLDTADESESMYTVYLLDKSLFFPNPPKNNVTAGLKVFFSKEATELSGSSDEPTLAEHLHSYLIYGACIDYSFRTGNDADWSKYTNLLFKKENEIKEYYTNRLAMESKVGIRIRGENYE